MYIPRKPAIMEIANIPNNLGVMWVLIFLRSIGRVVDVCERDGLLLNMKSSRIARSGKPRPILNIYISMGSNDFSKYCFATIVVMAHAKPEISANV